MDRFSFPGSEQYDVFVTSSLDVRDNAVKNIIFKAAAVAFQFFILHIFSWIAYKLNSYTAFLMFAEDTVQKFHFALSRKFNRAALLVLGFAILSLLFGFYDTMLWALDSPGFITDTSVVNASRSTSDMLANPSYVTFIGNPTENVEDIDIEASLNAGLYKTGFNFTLLPVPDLGQVEVIPPPKDGRNETVTGLRLWLDDEGLSVMLDNSTMVTSTYGSCPIIYLTPDSQGWNCQFNNTVSSGMILNRFNDPVVYWEGENYDILPIDRRSNPWNSLAQGGDTAIMKQVFTVTKGKKRHTFIESVFKSSLVTFGKTVMETSEITELLKRMWMVDPSEPIDANTQALADMVVRTRDNGTSLTFGVSLKANNTLQVSSIEFLHVTNGPEGSMDNLILSLFRVQTANLTMLRTETLEEEPTQYSLCRADGTELHPTNIAMGGKLTPLTCFKQISNAGPEDTKFRGQIDTSSIVIISDVAGRASSNASAAFNMTGYEWYVNKSSTIDDMLVSRAILLGGDKDIVNINVYRQVPAISYLQLFLTILPFVFVIASWILTRVSPMTYYQASFLSAVCTTTHVAPTTSCKKVAYLKNPPEIVLNSGQEHVTLGSNGGMFVHSPATPPLTPGYEAKDEQFAFMPMPQPGYS